MKTMRSLGIIFFSLLIALVYFSSQNISSSLSPPNFLPKARQPPRKLRVSSSALVHEHRKLEVTDEDLKTSISEEISTENKHEKSGDSIDEVVYHIDYHGVTTHPTPTPRHPRP
ncbi:uncharacterized protein LOC112091398 [Morus notabilis]|uniref:uncharacterized protein LOC112091398 n=1 Tax=Morus notabilis TaxID=981085 RepID=UPI000CED1174|nr:uncharacterized protein LOC112091398 [Morus notabilis]